MRNYFDKDIEKLQILKNGKRVCLIASVVSLVLTMFFAGASAYGNAKEGYPITKGEEQQLVEIANADAGYKAAYEKLSAQYAQQLENGQITEAQYEQQMKHLESHEFINRVVNSAKLNSLNDKIAQRAQFTEKAGQYAVLTAAATAAGAAGYAAMSYKRKKIKNRWYSEEEGRGI